MKLWFVIRGSLAIIQLCADIIQPGGIDAIGLSVDGLNQLFGFEFFENGERAVAEQEPFAAVAFNRSDAA
ncbi:conserved hypothetical protein [Klebsiella grimontii]|uniref:Uncharacterized protein n=1 Tax=Klebsiella grimontii TaxID=2058152 RepID=A0A285AZB3_9ENTR|nr:conserved hypothetical protein [Klebsiella grimontii]